MLHEVKYCLIDSMINCYKENLLDINSFFYNELDHYYQIHHLLKDGKAEMHRRLTKEIENFHFNNHLMLPSEHYDPDRDLKKFNL